MIGEQNKVKVALFVRLEAKPGKEADIESFLKTEITQVTHACLTGTHHERPS